MARPRPHDLYTLIFRKRSTGTVFPDSYADLDDACEAFDETDGIEFEFLGAAHTLLDHPAAPGTSSEFDISAATDQWRRDRAMEAGNRDGERARLRHLQAAE